MLFKMKDLERIKKGEISLAFRKWKSTRVKAGSLIKTALGLVEIESIHEIKETNIRLEDLRKAGYSSFDDWQQVHSKIKEGRTFVISLKYAGADPRIELRETPIQSNEAFENLKKKLEAFDKRSKYGPWTLKILQFIASNPSIRATDIALEFGIEKDWLKLNIRKLKNLGLTISLPVGYQISRRGSSYLSLHGN